MTQASSFDTDSTQIVANPAESISIMFVRDDTPQIEMPARIKIGVLVLLSLAAWSVVAICAIGLSYI